MDSILEEILVGRRIVYTQVDSAPILLCRGLTGQEKLISHINYHRAYKEALDSGLLPKEKLLVQLYHRRRLDQYT